MGRDNHTPRAGIREDDMRHILRSKFRTAVGGDPDAAKFFFDLQTAVGRGDLVRAAVRKAASPGKLKEIVWAIVEKAMAGDREAALIVIKLTGPMAEALDNLGLSDEEWTVIINVSRAS
jgi:hypothetical protein